MCVDSFKRIIFFRRRAEVAAAEKLRGIPDYEDSINGSEHKETDIN